MSGISPILVLDVIKVAADVGLARELGSGLECSGIFGGRGGGAKFAYDCGSSDNGRKKSEGTSNMDGWR